MSADKFNSLRARLVSFIAGERLNAEKLNGMYDFLRRDIEDAYGAIGDIYDENFDDTARNLSYRNVDNAPNRAFDIANLARIIGPASNLNPRFLSNRRIQLEQIPSNVEEYQTKYPLDVDADITITDFTKVNRPSFDSNDEFKIVNGTIHFAAPVPEGTEIEYTTNIGVGEGPNYADARFNVIPDPNQTTEKLVVNYNEQDNNYSILLPKVKGNQDDSLLSQESILFDEQIKLPKWMTNTLNPGDVIPQYSLYLKNRTTQESYVDAIYTYVNETTVTVSELSLGDQDCVTQFDLYLVTVGTDLTTSVDDLRKKWFEHKHDGSFGEPRISILDVVDIFKNQPSGNLHFGKSENAHNIFPMYLHREGYKEDANQNNGNNAMLGDLVMGLVSFQAISGDILRPVVGEGQSNKIQFGEVGGHQIYKDGSENLYIESKANESIIVGSKFLEDTINASIEIDQEEDTISTFSEKLKNVVKDERIITNKNNEQDVETFKMESAHSIKNEAHDIYEDEYVNYLEIKPHTSLPSAEAFKGADGATSNRLRFSHRIGDEERWLTNFCNVNGSVYQFINYDEDKTLVNLREIKDKAYINFKKYCKEGNNVYAVSGGYRWRTFEWTNENPNGYNPRIHNRIKFNNLVSGAVNFENGVYTYGFQQNWLQHSAVGGENIEDEDDVNESDLYGYIARNWNAVLVDGDNIIFEESSSSYTDGDGPLVGFGIDRVAQQPEGGSDNARLVMQIPETYVNANGDGLKEGIDVFLVNVAADELYTSSRYLAFDPRLTDTQFNPFGDNTLIKAGVYLNSNRDDVRIDGVNRLLTARLLKGGPNPSYKDVSPHSHWTYTNYDSLNFYCKRSIENFAKDDVTSRIIKRKFTINTIQKENADYYSSCFYYKGGYGDVTFDDDPVFIQSVNFILNYDDGDWDYLSDNGPTVKEYLLNSSIGTIAGSNSGTGKLKIFIVNGKEIFKTTHKFINFSRVLLEYLNQDLVVNESAFRDRVGGDEPSQGSASGGDSIEEQDTNLQHRRFYTRHFNRYFDIFAQLEETYIPGSNTMIINVDLTLNSYKSDRYYVFEPYDQAGAGSVLDTAIFKTDES